MWVTVKSVEKLAHIAACDILGYAVALTDLLGDACFVIFALRSSRILEPTKFRQNISPW